MWRLVLALGLCVWTFAPARAEPSCDELNALWRNKYAREFRVAWDVRDFSCSTENEDHALARALHVLHAADRNHAFYENARALTTRTRLRVDCIVPERGTGMARPELAAWMARGGERSASGAVTPRGVLTLCDPFFTTVEEPQRRAAILFHEAAHARPGHQDPRHVKCVAGEFRDVEGACDEEFTGSYEGSGFNWEVQFVAYGRRNAGDDLSRLIYDARLRHLLHNRFNNITQSQIDEWSGP